jgi:hypothetical protein
MALWNLRECGGSLIPAERWVMFHDPGGNLIELAQWAG